MWGLARGLILGLVVAEDSSEELLVLRGTIIMQCTQCSSQDSDDMWYVNAKWLPRVS
jgi:hypothetical protein